MNTTTATKAPRFVSCCHCNGTGNPGQFGGYIAANGERRCYCGNTGKIDVSRGSCCSCGRDEDSCRCEV